MRNGKCKKPGMLRSLFLAFALSLLTSRALAQSTTETFEARSAVPEEAEATPFEIDAVVSEVEVSVPAYGLAAPLFAAQLSASANARWFDRTWASLELAVGAMGSAYAAWTLSSMDESEGYASATTSMALAINLRLISHGALSWALYSDGQDARAGRLVPSVSVSPMLSQRERGATVTARWAF